LASQGFLKHIYESGAACFVGSGSQLMDMVIPLLVTSCHASAEPPEFLPMLVSIIFCQSSSFCLEDAESICDDMKERAMDDELEKALCLLMVFGSGSTPGTTLESSSSSLTTQSNLWNLENVSQELLRNQVVSKAILVPDNDEFGWNHRAFGEAMIPPSQVVNAEFLTNHFFWLAHSVTTGSSSSSTAIACEAASATSSKALSDKYQALLESVMTHKNRDKDEQSIKENTQLQS
jgi:hypothetical protein